MNEKSNSFSEKYPKLNMLLGIFILLILVAIVVLLFVLIGRGIGSLIGRLVKMDAVVVVAIITGGVSITGVVLSSIVGKSLEYKKARKEYLAQKREEPYGSFIDLVYKVKKSTNNPGLYTQEELEEEMDKFSKQLIMWGSPKVSETWKSFRDNGTNSDNPLQSVLVLEELINEMRKDLGVKKLDKGGVLSFYINDVDRIINNGN